MEFFLENFNLKTCNWYLIFIIILDKVEESLINVYLLRRLKLDFYILRF